MPNRTTGYGIGKGRVQVGGGPPRIPSASDVTGLIPLNTKRPVSLRPGMIQPGGVQHHYSSAVLGAIPTSGQSAGENGEQFVNAGNPATWTSGQPAAFQGNGYLVDGSGGGGSETVVSYTLDPAAVLDLLTTPYELVAAPGAGKIVIVDWMFAYLNFNTTAYTFDGSLLTVYNPAYGFSMPAISGDLAGLLTAIETTTTFNVGDAQTLAATIAVAAVNQSVALKNVGGVTLADGDSDLTLVLGYHIITLP